MTIFRFSAAVGIAAMTVASAICAPAISAAPTKTEQECGNINPQTVRSCLSRRIEAKEQHLGTVYTRALAAVADGFKKYGGFDNRTDPMFLRKSQAEWVRFVEDDCTVQAAFGGGSNSSISDRLTDCYEGELDRRIAFLEQLADGSFGGP